MPQLAHGKNLAFPQKRKTGTCTQITIVRGKMKHVEIKCYTIQGKEKTFGIGGEP